MPSCRFFLNKSHAMSLFLPFCQFSLKNCTDRFDNLDTFLQNVKNTCNFHSLPDILIL